MDYKDINNILDKYFEGDSTFEEEVFLKEYFKNDTIVPEHKALKPLFNFYEEEAYIKNPSPIQFNNFKRKRNYKFATAVVVVLAMGIASIMFRNETETPPVNEYVKGETKKEIYKEVKKYSNDVNKGIRQLSAFGFFGSTNKKIKKTKDTIKSNKK